jgi:hypothetical protein
MYMYFQQPAIFCCIKMLKPTKRALERYFNLNEPSARCTNQLASTVLGFGKLYLYYESSRQKPMAGSSRRIEIR